MQNIFSILIFPFIMIYMLIPYFITRIIGFGVFSKGKKDKQIAFTFDDGPDPRYTPELLELLKQNNMKGTFFVLGSKAEKYPELIRRIYDEGHQIGIHNYTHKTNWFMTPGKVKREQVERTASIVEQIIGERPIYYRPPWGILNIGDVISLRKNYRIILWSVMPRDWNEKVGAEKLRRRLIKNIKPGSIILLHDSGDTLGADEGAPRKMLEGLAGAIENLKSRGYTSVRVDHLMDKTYNNPYKKLKWTKKVMIKLWLAWDALFCKVFGVRAVNEKYPFIKTRLRKYTSLHPLQLSDGETIVKGDTIAEMHFDNKMLIHMSLESKNSLHLATRMVRQAQKSLPCILNKIETDSKYQHVKGLYGISMVHRGVEHLGFTVLDLPKSLFKSLTQIYLKILISVLHPSGNDRIKLHSDLLVPKTIAISRKHLSERYKKKAIELMEG
jgi:peptidoglycan-N-acetylglucosamine deacetylase